MNSACWVLQQAWRGSFPLSYCIFPRVCCCCAYMGPSVWVKETSLAFVTVVHDPRLVWVQVYGSRVITQTSPCVCCCCAWPTCCMGPSVWVKGHYIDLPCVCCCCAWPTCCMGQSVWVKGYYTHHKNVQTQGGVVVLWYWDARDVPKVGGGCSAPVKSDIPSFLATTPPFSVPSGKREAVCWAGRHPEGVQSLRDTSLPGEPKSLGRAHHHKVSGLVVSHWNAAQWPCEAIAGVRSILRLFQSRKNLFGNTATWSVFLRLCHAQFPDSTNKLIDLRKCNNDVIWLGI